MLNFGTIQFRYGILFLVLLSLAACSSQNERSSDAAIQPLSMDDLAGLPAVGDLNAGHQISAVTDEDISPLSRQDNSPDASESGGSLLLSSSAGQSSWAIYAFTVADADLFSLKGQIGLDPGEGYWLAVANAASGRWEFGQLLQSTSFSRNITGYESDGHLISGTTLYFAMVAYDGDTIGIVNLSASVEFPPVLHSISGQVKDGSDAALQGVLPLGEQDQTERQANRDADRPVEPCRVEDVRHQGLSESRQTGSVAPSTAIVPAGVNSTVSCSTSCTREVT